MMDTERFEKFQKDLLAAEHHFHQRIDKLKEDFQNMSKEFQKPPKDPENVVFDKLVIKYWAGFSNGSKISPEYKTTLYEKGISILFPPANKNWTLAIMNACEEYCQINKGHYPSFDSSIPRKLNIICL